MQVPYPDSTQTRPLPPYWQQTYFQHHPYLHPEASIQAPGYPAQPPTYTPVRDDILLLTLLLLTVTLLTLLRKTHTYLRQHTRTLLYPTTHQPLPVATTTPVEYAMPHILVLIHSILLGTLYTITLYQYGHRMPGSRSPHTLILIATAGILALHTLRYLTYTFVNWVFFDKIKRHQWRHAATTVLYLQTIAILPLTYLLLNPHIPPLYTLFATLAILIVTEILYIHDLRQIFFPKFYGILHLMSYICALEIMPLIALMVILANIVDTLAV